jgi:hypothetical protein
VIRKSVKHGSEGGGWKSAYSSNSLAAHPTSRPVRRGPGGSNAPWLPGEYQRNGVRNLNMFFEPLVAQRQVRLTERHTMQDFAHHMRWLVDECHPEAEMILLVLDNFDPHKPASLYETFPPEETRRILKRQEFHYTPKHGSWLNMAEIELSVYDRRLKEHIPDDPALFAEIQAITSQRNSAKVTVDWQFRTLDARIKLKHLYPSILS